MVLACENVGRKGLDAPTAIKFNSGLVIYIYVVYSLSTCPEYRGSLVCELAKALTPFDEFQRISLENKGNSSSGTETRNFVLSQSVIRE